MKNSVRLSFLISSVFYIISCNQNLPSELESASVNLPDKIDFNYHVKPILSDRCFTCHGPDANQRKGELRLDIEENAYAVIVGESSIAPNIITPKSLKKSEFFHRITSDEPDYMMPPPESNLKLNNEEKALLAKWIQQGAEYKPHWSFVAPKKESSPKISKTDWPEQPFDHFILAQMEKKGLVPAEKASKTTLLRRISFDLTGLPPQPEEIEAFLKDRNPDAYEKAIDRLFESPRYGERMAVEWLDVARYADSHGYQDDGMRTTWPWRKWVIDKFNENMPYDQFLIEQLAGDLLPNANKDQILATCFNRNHPQTQEGGVVDEEYRVEYVADRTNTFGTALMGLTMECARCHDHKYDPISQKDYYSMYAFFNNNNDTGIVPYNGEAAPTIMLPTPEEERKLAELRAKIKPLERAILPENYVGDFKKWLKKMNPKIDNSEGLVASFDFDRALEVPKRNLNLDGKKSPGWAGIGKNGKTTSYLNKAKQKADAAIVGDLDRSPILVEGKLGNALQFQGDAGVRFNRDLDFDRDQPFSVSIWVKLLKEGERGPIFNNTNGDFEGYRGWICKLNEDGTLSFQLNHVWPDNCIDYQTTEKLPIGEWIHIVMTYDGSSKAKGLRFFVNGKVPPHQLYKDNLTKSLLHGVKGSNWSSFPFMIGKEKERTIENVVMDELRVFNRQISEMEIQFLYNSQQVNSADDSQLLEHYLLSRQNAQFNKKYSALAKLRKEENLTATDVLEVMVMKERKNVRSTFILDRGMYDAPGVEVMAAVPSIFDGIPDELPQNRLGLAQWLVSTKHPLTARVQVNRIWKMIFGKGLVSTQEDFGNQGELPTHPELLDWLAVDFMENDWNIKALMKKILLSATYQQSSTASELAKAEDPTNYWYSYFPVYRMSAEMIRDNALTVSGLLVDSIGGPSVYPYQPKGIWKALATRNATEYKQGTGNDLYRRSMYTIWKRSAPPPSMLSFDAPDRYYCVVNRQKTATPLQSLVLMNDPQYLEAARMLGERTMVNGGQNVAEKIDYLYKCAIGRSPEAKESQLVEKLFNESLQDFRHNEQKAIDLLEVGEHPVDTKLDQAELAAYAIVASTVMNFDEFVMKR